MHGVRFRTGLYIRLLLVLSRACVGLPPIRPGREVTTPPPLGLEAKSLKNGMTHYWISRSRAHSKQTNKQTLTKIAVPATHIGARMVTAPQLGTWCEGTFHSVHRLITLLLDVMSTLTSGIDRCLIL